MDQTNLKPFIKWVGGKKDVIKKHLYQYLPKEFNCYYEPFLGGAAMLAYLKPKKAVVNDLNQELIATYQVIKNNLDKLIIQLKSLEKLHCESFYYKTRAQHINKSIKLAARFIYLNKTGFTSYTKSGFNQFNQKELANYLKLLDQKGIKWMLTNHNTKLINELYQDYKIIPIETNRNINCKSDLRKNSGNEVVIINY